jgi:hypothetical protein
LINVAQPGAAGPHAADANEPAPFGRRHLAGVVTDPLGGLVDVGTSVGAADFLSLSGWQKTEGDRGSEVKAWPGWAKPLRKGQRARQALLAECPGDLGAHEWALLADGVPLIALRTQPMRAGIDNEPHAAVAVRAGARGGCGGGHGGHFRWPA